MGQNNHKDSRTVLKNAWSIDILRNTLKDILEKCSGWMEQWSVVAPMHVIQRRRYMLGVRCFVQTVLGVFVKPQLRTTSTAYIFQGLLNKEYMQAFSPESVVVVGSHREREFARKNGYGFAWSFPIESAIRSSMGRGWNYPAIRQLRLWLDRLSKYERVIFFLQEDTQPLGTFFVYTGRLLTPKASSVCIQHGIFLKYYYPLRNEGELSDINFVWDWHQVELIRSNKDKTFRIGLPYVATAKPFSDINVVLVGTGVAGSGTEIYERSITTYFAIKDIFTNNSIAKIFYRPHPNERNDKILMAKLAEKFCLVESSDKLQQLNGPRAIFIGVESSLLYEAGQAGHLVARLKLNASVPTFHFDFEFTENEVNELLQWALSNRYGIWEPTLTDRLSPLERFNQALSDANLMG